MKGPFPIDPVLMAIAIAYKNLGLIADFVLPYVPVGKAEFKYWKYDLAEGFTLPNTKVGRKSKPNEVEFSATEVTDSTEDYALDDKIPQSDILNAPANYDPVSRAVEGIMDLIKLDREKRTADMVFKKANYTHAITLAGQDQFSDYVNSNPINVINAALDAPIMRPNTAVLGQSVWTKLKTHPAIVQAVFGANQTKGIVSREQFAQLFELSEVLVGQGFLNTAKKGQTPNLARVWGKHISFIHKNTVASNSNGTTFGFTARFGDPVAGQWEDRNVGMRGGQVVRAGESVKELICAKDIAYFIENAVA